MTTAAGYDLIDSPPNSHFQFQPETPGNFSEGGLGRPAGGRREGAMGKAFPYPVAHGLVLCPVSAVGRRSVTLGPERQR
jgi:hypothetical protein